MNQVGNLKKSQVNPALLPHAKVAELTRIYGKSGECRVKLTELAIGVVNRGISWKYVHSLIHRILMEEGSARNDTNMLSRWNLKLMTL